MKEPDDGGTPAEPFNCRLALWLAMAMFVLVGMSTSSTVLAPDQQQRVAQSLEQDAQVMGDEQLESLFAGQPEEGSNEIIRINTDARSSALQIVLLVPILAGLAGLLASSAW